MIKLKISALSVQVSDKALQQSAAASLDKIIDPEIYELTEQNADILLFLSGGTEQLAKAIAKAGNFYILIGSRHNNSYASATEVKSYLDENNIASLLLDEEDKDSSKVLKNLYHIKKAFYNLKGKRLGLIGQVSDWLISSDIPAELLEDKFGIELLNIPWNKLANYSEYKASGDFINTFSTKSDIDLSKTAQVNELLKHTIKSQKLDAITVECFPMVINDKVTACLPLAKLNNDGIPAGCEGDITSVTGMMLCKELTGIVPWMANINKVSNKGCIFSHCTIAPNLLSDYSIETHFETGLGTAIQGDFKEDRVTVFRFNRLLNKAFIAYGKIVDRPKSETACRTQVEVKLGEKEVELLKNKPLGNHHLILPGDYRSLLELCCRFLNIEVL